MGQIEFKNFIKSLGSNRLLESSHDQIARDARFESITVLAIPHSGPIKSIIEKVVQK